MSAPVESALQDDRIEYVEETTIGQTPSDPNWLTLTDYLDELSLDPGGQRSGIEVVGSGDVVEHFRGPEDPSLDASYYKQQAFVDSNDDPNYPAARPLTYDWSTDYPSYTVEYRRDVGGGGNDGAGFREYIVARGARPTELTLPGDPSDGEPMLEEISWEVEQARAFVIHQPSSSTTLDVTNNGGSSIDVTIENEGASTAETITVPANSTATTTANFGDVDAIYAESEPSGTIDVTDGAGTGILDQPLAGTDTTNVDGERGVPPLGSGSHGSSIGTDPSKYLFLGVDTVDWQGASLADRIHALDLTVAIDTSTEAVAGTRGQETDAGTREATADADVAGPHKSAQLIADQFRNESGDFVYKLPDNDVTLRNAYLTVTPDFTRSAGDENFIPSVTFRGEETSSNAAVTVTNTT
jgi:hypothetical protein